MLNAIGNVLTANSATAYTAGEVSAIASVLLPGRADAHARQRRRRSPRARRSGPSRSTAAKLADDVIDAEFALLTNFVITTGDGVDANDKAFSSSFPYLASPH